MNMTASKSDQPNKLTKMPKKIAILLTACINPNAEMVERRDPSDRMQDYKTAIKKWVQANGFSGLVFCENSGAELLELEKEAKTVAPPNLQLEFLSFQSAFFDPALGKGWGEMDIIGHALANSKILSKADVVVKVTGRLFVRNIDQLAQLLIEPPYADVYCDLRQNLTLADSRVFCASTKFIRSYLLTRQECLNDSAGIYFEHMLARAVHAAMADGFVWSPLPRVHWLEGIAGTSNKKIPSGIFRHYVREIFRAIKSQVMRR